MSGAKKKIGVFGGTFDPVHKGHSEVVAAVKKEIRPDKIYVVPARNPWMKENKKIASFKHRVEMLKVVFDRAKNVEIMADEKAEETSYTKTTLAKIGKKHPGSDLFLVLGEDVITRINEWKGIKEILRKVTVVCVKRGEQVDNDITSQLKEINQEARVVVLEKVKSSASSTEYKNNNKASFISKDVLEYIYKNNVYKNG